MILSLLPFFLLVGYAICIISYQGWQHAKLRKLKLQFRLVSNYQLNAHFLYSITIYMLHYNPRHISSSTMLIFRRTNCINTAPGIVTVCERPYSMPVESGLESCVFICWILYVFVVPYVYLLYYVCIAVLTLDTGLLARSQYPEGPAIGHLDTGFSWFPCGYKQMLRWFPSFQVATTCPYVALPT